MGPCYSRKDRRSSRHSKTGLSSQSSGEDRARKPNKTVSWSQPVARSASQPPLGGGSSSQPGEDSSSQPPPGADSSSQPPPGAGPSSQPNQENQSSQPPEASQSSQPTEESQSSQLHHAGQSSQPLEEDEKPFPWHLGLFDAHCHPTDTMQSAKDIQSMKTHCLCIMATREEDQELVANLADVDIYKEESEDPFHFSGHVIPCFGWHPWFSHLLYDDTQTDFDKSEVSKNDFKTLHYQRVLTGPEKTDPNFLNALPDPKPLSAFIDKTRSRLQNYSMALVGEIGLDNALVGEIGIDKAFFLPLPRTAEDPIDTTATPGSRDGRKLSRTTVTMSHQKAICLAQLRLAGEMNRAVSVHGVQAHGVLFDTLQKYWKGDDKDEEKDDGKEIPKKKKKRNLRAEIEDEGNRFGIGTEFLDGGESPKQPPRKRICLHSYSGSADTVKLYLKSAKSAADIYFSFSWMVNLSRATSAKRSIDVIKSIPDNRILVESDHHEAGDEMDRLIKEITKKICQIKGWELEAGILTLKNNWTRFVFGREMVWSSQETEIS